MTTKCAPVGMTSLPKTVAHLLKAVPVAGGRLQGDGCRRWKFEHNGQQFFVEAVKPVSVTGRSVWSVHIGRLRSAEEIAQNEAKGWYGMQREYLHSHAVRLGAKLPEVNKSINEAWAVLLASGKLEVTQ